MIGTFLEQFYHELSTPLIFFSLGYGVFMQTGYKSVLVFGFLCAIFSKSVVLTAIDAAVVKNGLRDAANKKIKGKLEKIKSAIGKVNIKGGGTETGAKLYSAYDYVREFWSYPFNIVIVNIIIIFEIINWHYNIWPSYLIIYWYLAIYGSISVVIQTISFMAHYKGKTVYHYYMALFGKK